MHPKLFPLHAILYLLLLSEPATAADVPSDIPQWNMVDKTIVDNKIVQARSIVVQVQTRIDDDNANIALYQKQIADLRADIKKHETVLQTMRTMETQYSTTTEYLNAIISKYKSTYYPVENFEYYDKYNDDYPDE